MLPMLTGAFGLSVAVWSTWFVTHLPWSGVPEQVSLPLILVVWFLGSAILVARSLACRIGPSLAMGVTTAAIGLLLLGTKLTEASAEGSASLRPNAAVMAGGFLALGAVIGVLAALLGRLLPGVRTPHGYVPLDSGNANARWLGRFAIVTACAMFPLLLVGGLVTSTSSGMAVPDWPNTFGSNMFLYPLGPRAQPGVFLEHSHRLFGTFVGLCAIVLTCLTFLYESRKGVRAFAVAILLLVVVQGLLGGLRVREGNAIHDLDDRMYRLIHGVLGQLVFALGVAFAAMVSRAVRDGDGAALAAANPKARRVKVFAAAAMHSTILQLLFGAVYRHLRDQKGGGHALMAHMAFSLIVVATAGLAASVAVGLKGDRKEPLTASLRRSGQDLFFMFSLQFVLGWVAWSLGGKGLQPEHTWQAILRTAHQANGALLLGLLTWMWVLARRIPKASPLR
jgi:cytochrome c oxidase assembly protein subunit 15